MKQRIDHPEPEADEVYRIYGLANIGYYSSGGATRLPTGTKIYLEPESPAVSVKETAAVDHVIYTASEAVADVATATVTYEMLATGDHAHFTFDAATRQIKVKDGLDFEGSKTSYTVTIRATATDSTGTEYTDKVVTINVADGNDLPPEFRKSVTADDTVFVYKTPVDEARTSFIHFQSSVDLSTGRHGAEGTGPITITLLRENSYIEITGEIAGLPSTNTGSSYRVFAARNGETWSLQSVIGSGTPTGQMK